MHSLIFSVLLVLTWNQVVHIAGSVKIVELRVPRHTQEGGEATLGCRYDLQNDTLYTLKWFKDSKEFYRYSPSAEQQTRIFYVSGVNVDRNKSGSDFVTLRHLSHESAGVYRCEVYGEHPKFAIASEERRVSVDLLPKSDPTVEGLQKEYKVGSKVDVNCTTEPSRPEAQLQWLVNGQPPPKSYLGAPVLIMSSDHPHSSQTKLNLHYTVYQSHYIHGYMNITCLATIPPLYHRITEYQFSDPWYHTTLPPPSTTETNVQDGDGASNTRVSILCLVLIYLFTFIL